jgi:hypothetical protein
VPIMIPDHRGNRQGRHWNLKPSNCQIYNPKG